MRDRLAEIHDRAAQAVDPDAWHYLSRGAADGLSVSEAEAAWAHWRLRPRVLRDVSRVDTSVELFGSWATPIGVAPTAFHGLLTAEGEVATAAAAQRVGAPMVLSSRSTRLIEDVAAQIDGPWWFQVYLMRDRSITDRLIERAAAAGASAMVLTGDTPYVGYRAPNPAAARPIPLTAEQSLVNVAGYLPDDGSDPWESIDQRPDQTLADIDRIARIADLPVIVKGVLRGDDALACLDAGAEAVWVSNHGGRQLDRALPTAVALPDVVRTVGGAAPVLVDGGVRSGIDALTALALGARAVFVGRPVMWGLAAYGADGAAEVLGGLTGELQHAMGLAGANSLAALDRSLVAPA
ncbi:alpha-hydroxy acid oxidase [Flexivirga meconopsidis]|uniref:alpha-hydroxy acid oxidase n=1 Tax=Flexivirga meconopsidis TaxID=2977121 RepID=UPI00224055AE